MGLDAFITIRIPGKIVAIIKLVDRTWLYHPQVSSTVLEQIIVTFLVGIIPTQIIILGNILGMFTYMLIGCVSLVGIIV